MPLQYELFSETAAKENFIQEFIEFPHVLFASDSSVKKLPFELESIYFKIHPMEHDFLLIKKDGVILLRAMLCLTPFEQLAYFGLIDFNYKHNDIESVLEAFKDWSKNWCLKHNMAKLYGPINFSTWLPYRLFSKADNEWRFDFEPDRPVAYCELLKKAGFVTAQTYSSTGYEGIDGFVQGLKSDYEKALSLGFSFEFFPEELNEADLIDLHRLSVKIFADNYLATPIDFNVFKGLYVSQAKKGSTAYSLFILSPGKERIGFFLTFPESDHLIMKTIGVDSQFRGCGLSNGAMHLSLLKAQQEGFSKACAAMVKAHAQSESYGKRMTLVWTHLYEVLELPLV